MNGCVARAGTAVRRGRCRAPRPRPPRPPSARCRRRGRGTRAARAARAPAPTGSRLSGVIGGGPQVHGAGELAVVLRDDDALLGDAASAAMTVSTSATWSSRSARRSTSVHSSTRNGASSGRAIRSDTGCGSSSHAPDLRTYASVSRPPKRHHDGDYAQPRCHCQRSPLIPGIGTLVNVTTVLLGSDPRRAPRATGSRPGPATS